MRYWILLAASLSLYACAGDKAIPAKAELLTCESYASALASLAGFKDAGKLNAGTIAIVDHVRDTLNPICLGPTPDVDATVKDVAVDAGVQILNSILATVF